MNDDLVVLLNAEPERKVDPDVDVVVSLLTSAIDALADLESKQCTNRSDEEAFWHSFGISKAGLS